MIRKMYKNSNKNQKTIHEHIKLQEICNKYDIEEAILVLVDFTNFIVDRYRKTFKLSHEILPAVNLKTFLNYNRLVLNDTKHFLITVYGKDEKLVIEEIEKLLCISKKEKVGKKCEKD